VTPGRIVETLPAAYLFLEELGASPQLILHVKLVGEAAELLITKLTQLAIQFDARFVRLGVAFHDAGKILHPAELSSKGNYHEVAGESLLIANGLDPTLARCCRSHGRWQTLECSLEELIVALADTLWKGKRNTRLEELVIAKLAVIADRDYWDLFVELDSCFETIAIDGDSRLYRSQAFAAK
jgi:HD domain